MQRNVISSSKMSQLHFQQSPASAWEMRIVQLRAFATRWLHMRKQKARSYPMFTYRKLAYEQSVEVARHLIEHCQEKALRDFLDTFYGSDAYLVGVEVELDRYGARVANVRVCSIEREVVLPNLELPGWRELLAADADVFNPRSKEEEQLDAIGCYMVQHNVYLDYGIDPVEREELRIEAGSLAPPPEFYTLEVDAPYRPGEAHTPYIPPSPVFLATISAVMQRTEQFCEQAMQIADQVNQLYIHAERDDSPLDRMITQARLRCFYAEQRADEACKYLAFMLRECAAQSRRAGPHPPD